MFLEITLCAALFGVQIDMEDMEDTHGIIGDTAM